MRTVKKIVWLDGSERESVYSTGIKFIFEDESTLELMTTDYIADKFTPAKSPQRNSL